MTGSHIDTVRTGGRYDGNLGVLAGLEVVEVLEGAGVTTRRPLAVAFFTNEEGSRFQPDMMGSLTYVGGMALEEALDVAAIDGADCRRRARAHRLRRSVAVPGPAPAAFVELHIEQGPVLEARGTTIGVGRGRAGHLVARADDRRPVEPRRHDADVDAPRRRARRRRDRDVRASSRATSSAGTKSRPSGASTSHPDLVNVIPGRAVLTVDLRNTDAAALADAEAALADFCARARATGGRRDHQPLAGAVRARDVRSRHRRCSSRRPRQRLGYSVHRLPSGAGHDAQMIARVCPAAMVFTPSRGGISHNPAEHTDPEHLEAGANVLLQVLLELAEREEA